MLTHFHYDHIGNVDLFPNAKIVVSSRELEFWRRPISNRLQFRIAVEESELEHMNALDGEGGRLEAVSAETPIAPGG